MSNKSDSVEILVSVQVPRQVWELLENVSVLFKEKPEETLCRFIDMPLGALDIAMSDLLGQVITPESLSKLYNLEMKGEWKFTPVLK